MQEVEPGDAAGIQSLFKGLDFNLTIPAALAGDCLGRFFVDSVSEPTVAVAFTTETTALVGAQDGPGVIALLRTFIYEKVFAGLASVEDSGSMSLQVDPPSWEQCLPDVIPDRDIEKAERFHYVCRHQTRDCRPDLPEGYELRAINQDLLANSDLLVPEAIPETIELLWGDISQLVSRGAGLCIVHDDRVVSWCLADCASNDRIEIGVRTLPAYRRQGLASTVAAATVENCFQRGFAEIGWHCEADNTASWKTAEKAGFHRERQYSRYYYMFDPVDHLAELGWFHFKKGQFGRTAGYYEQVFALREDNPDYYYHLAAVAAAAMGDTQQALEHLHAAIDHGWADIDTTMSIVPFQQLQGTPAWEAILARMRQSEDSR
jgi:GNAT superfamily N-acetyltransferase